MQFLAVVGLSSVSLLAVSWGQSKLLENSSIFLAWGPLLPSSKPATVGQIPLTLQNSSSPESSVVASLAQPAKVPHFWGFMPLRWAHWRIEDHLQSQILDFIAFANSLLPCKITPSQVIGLRYSHLWGAIILITMPTYNSSPFRLIKPQWQPSIGNAVAISLWRECHWQYLPNYMSTCLQNWPPVPLFLSISTTHTTVQLALPFAWATAQPSLAFRQTTLHTAARELYKNVNQIMPVTASMLRWLPIALNEIPTLSLAYKSWETQPPVTSLLLSPLQMPGLLPVLREFSPCRTFCLKTLPPGLDHNGPWWLRTSSNLVSLERPGPLSLTTLSNTHCSFKQFHLIAYSFFIALVTF